MIFSNVFPIVALVALSALMLSLALKPELKISPQTLVAVSILFLTFSVFVILNEGPFGFWTEHIRNLWGNQIWLDLLLAATASWSLIVPRASRLRMRTPAWLLLVLSSGSFGLLLMISRVIYLEEKESRTTSLANEHKMAS